MTLAEQINLAMKSDARCDDVLTGLVPSDIRVMQAIIRQLTDIVKVQHDALIYVESNYEGANKAAIVSDALALSAPIVEDIV